MFLKSLLVDVINKYLGDYVKNLDTSQLKVKLWRGDVELQNLDLKESALDGFDLPMKIKTGHIEKLTLKIPWKNLTRESVFMCIDGLYALAVPNVAISYSAEKEENAKQESKQKKLLKIEEAKKAAAVEQGEEEEPDSFFEKVAALIIKNLEIEIKNIHFRFEDGHTNPDYPFSVGVSLAEILFKKGNERHGGEETVQQIFKLVRLDSLAVYWNSSSEQYASLSKEQLLERLGKEIAGLNKVKTYQYLMEPVTAEAHLKLNMKPKLNNFSIPKVSLNVTFDEIGICLSKAQYNDVLAVIESFERMHLMSIYRKYRPDVPHRRHAKTWWHFARDCVLEEMVRRRRRMFSWSHIIHHRTVMKKYKTAYSKMLSNPKKVSRTVRNDIEDCENFLDVFSITLMRSQADMEVAKLSDSKLTHLIDWFRSVFLCKRKKRENEGTDLKEKIQQELTATEKTKLYEAIGYQENEVDPVLPREYEAVKFETKFKTLSLTLRDDTKEGFKYPRPV